MSISISSRGAGRTHCFDFGDRSQRMKLSRLILILFVIIVAVQLYRPARTSPPEDPSHTLKASAQVPTEVDRILSRSCSDCHSYKTTWPWYSRVAPVSWLV